MIRYALKCTDDHSFDSWFASADAFEKLQSTGMVVCPVCGSASVKKAIMAPRVTPGRAKAETGPKAGEARSLANPMSEAEVEVAKMRKHVEENSDYVGLSFAAEARKMHEGDTPQRSIYGEAKMEDAKKLVEEGIPVAPLPFMPQRKTN